MTWLYRSMRGELRHLDGARLADPAQVVAAQVDQHHVLGPLLRVGQQLGGQPGVLVRGRPARPGAGDRVQHRPAPPVVSADLEVRLRRGADDVERRRSAAGTCTGSGWSPAAPGRRPAGRRRWPARTAGPPRSGSTRRPGSPPWPPRPPSGSRLGRAADAPVDRPVAAHRGDHRRDRPGQRGGHRVQPAHGVVVGGADRRPVGRPRRQHRVGDQHRRAVVVVEHHQVGGEHHAQLGHAAGRRAVSSGSRSNRRTTS